MAEEEKGHQWGPYEIGPTITVRPGEADILNVMNLGHSWVFAVEGGKLVLIGNSSDECTMTTLMTMGGREIVNVFHEDVYKLNVATADTKVELLSCVVDRDVVEAFIDILTRAKTFSDFILTTSEEMITTYTVGDLKIVNGIPDHDACACGSPRNRYLKHYAEKARQATEFVKTVKQGFVVAKLEAGLIGDVRLVLRRVNGREKMTKYAGRVPPGGV